MRGASYDEDLETPYRSRDRDSDSRYTRDRPYTESGPGSDPSQGPVPMRERQPPPNAPPRVATVEESTWRRKYETRRKGF
jgi:hypothetical protein